MDENFKNDNMENQNDGMYQTNITGESQQENETAQPQGHVCGNDKIYYACAVVYPVLKFRRPLKDDMKKHERRMLLETEGCEVRSCESEVLNRR